MGACVTPNKNPRYHQLNTIPLPNQSTSKISADPSQIRPNSIDSKIQSRSRVYVPSPPKIIEEVVPNQNVIRQEGNRIVNQPPTSFLLKTQNDLNSNLNIHSNRLPSQPSNQNQNVANKNNPLNSSHFNNISSNQSSPRNTPNFQSQTIIINPGTIPTLLRQQPTFSRQKEPQTVSNTVQRMVDTYHQPITPNFRNSAVNKLSQLQSNSSAQIPRPLKLTNPNSQFIPLTPNLITTPSNITVDKSLLTFDKNMFKSQSTTPMPQSFKYDISLPNQRSMF